MVGGSPEGLWQGSADYIACLKTCHELEDIGSLLITFMEGAAGMLDDRLGIPKDLGCQEHWGPLTSK